ncbi:MAG: 4Fe-4S binding protein [Synergistaceae bacterium]|nr:4Fe-4S binding protein [Synergistaceae bacterium]
MRLIRINAEGCKGCGICVAFCPVKVLEMSGELNARGVHFPVTVESRADRCTKCKTCMIHCPDFAIVVTQE